MGRIGYCEVCGVAQQRRAAEIYDGVDNAPDACWQCERALKFEQGRIIDILEDAGMIESPTALFSKIIGDFEFKLPDGNDVVERNIAFLAIDKQLARIVTLIKGDE